MVDRERVFRQSERTGDGLDDQGSCLGQLRVPRGSKRQLGRVSREKITPRLGLWVFKVKSQFWRPKRELTGER